MRVRIGKSIKAQSLLGNQTVIVKGSSSTATTVIMFHKNHFYYDWSWGSHAFNITAQAHKYFFYVKFKNNINIRHTISMGTSSNGIGTYDYYNTIVNSNERYVVIDNTNLTISTIESVYLYYNGNYSSEKFNDTIDIPEYYFLVDLTDIFGSGKEPAREQFYNKYKDKFKLLAAGNEITIDSGTGNVALWPRIPIAYQEVEYIASSGTQYIDPGITLNNNMSFDFDIYWTAKTTFLFGVNSGGQETLLMPQKVYLNGGSKSFSSDIISLNQKYHFEFNMVSANAYIKRDGEVLFSRNAGTCKDESELLFFANVFVGSETRPQTYQQYRLYNFNLRENGVLKHQFIPCYRVSDNVIGLYDTIDHTFYSNAGTGTFTKGANVDYVQSCNPRLTLLPLSSAYQEVEYIQSSGTQYINTNITSTTTKLRIKAKVETVGSSQDIPIFGCLSLGNYASNAGFPHLTPYSNKWYYGTQGNEYNNNCAFNPTSGVIYVIDYNNNNKIKINDTEFAMSLGPKTNGNICIARRGSSDGNRYGVWKYYYFQIFEENTLVRNFVPCYRKSDSVIGLFDTVTQTFYTNSGTGTFTKGADKNTII